jgi:hypothetical protein
VSLDKVYTCELAIPLKYLSPLLTDVGSFSYTIKINGTKLGKFVDSNFKETEAPDVATMATSTLAGFPMLELITTNEITGTYTLVKK